MINRFERFHPIVPFLFYIGAVSLLILMLHPIFLAAAFMVIILLNWVHDGLLGLRRWGFFLFITFLLFMVMNPVFNERGLHLLFTVGQHRVTLEAVVYGGMNALSIIGIISIFVSYNVIMTPNKLLYLFARILPQAAVLLMLTLRFIPLMRRRLAEISDVQRSKGISVSYGKWRTRANTGMLYLQTLLTYSLEEAIQTADSMKARGYGSGTRTSYEYFKFQRRDAIAIIYLLVLFSTILYGRMSGYGYLIVYPLMETWKFSAGDSGVFVLFILFLSFPIWIEAGEIFRWRLSN